MTSLYSIQLQLPNTTPVFNGYFEVDNGSNVIQHFYDTSNSSVDILSSSGDFGADNYYEPGWLSFSGAGTNLLSFPAGGASSSDFHVTGDDNGNTNTGRIYWNNNTNSQSILFVIASISTPPAPTDPIANLMYSIQLQLPDTTPVFNGYFETLPLASRIQHFYDTSAISVDILSSGDVGGPDYRYVPGWSSFSSYGTNLLSLAAGGASSTDFRVSGNDGASNAGQIHWNDNANDQSILFVIASISSPPAPTDPIANLMYSIQLQLPDTTPVFNGYFETLPLGRMQHFYDTSNSSVDILSSGDVGGPDYRYVSGWLSFSGAGTNLLSFPAGGASSTDFHVIGDDGASNAGSIYWNDGANDQSILFVIASISSPPAPTDPIANLMYSIQLQLPDTTPVFNGYFETLPLGRMQHFYDTSNSSVDILSSGDYRGPDYRYVPGWLSFSSVGTNLLSFPAGGASSTDFHVTGSEGDSTTGQIIWNNDSRSQSILFVIASISTPPAPTDPFTTSLYSVQLQLYDTTPLFNGYFETVPLGYIQHFYDTSNISVDILSSGDFGGPNYLYQPGWLSFSNVGTNILSFPALGSSSSDFHLAGDNGASNAGDVTWNDGSNVQSILFVFASISTPPDPTPPIVANNALYSIQLTLTSDSSVVFNGYFEVNGISNVIQHFYDTSDSTTIVADILSTGTTGSPDKLYESTWASFDGQGVNITSIPYFFGSIAGDYHITGTSTGNTGVVDGTDITFSIAPITSVPSVTGTITPNFTYYSVGITLTDTTPIFNGYFVVNNTTNLLHHFYDTSNLGTDILSTGSTGSPDYMYMSGWFGFDGSGINITNFPYFFGFVNGDYHMVGNADSSNAGLAYGVDILYTIASITEIPAATSPITSLLSFYSMTLNAGSATILNSFFSVLNATNVIQRFEDTSNLGTNILSSGSWSSPDYLYQDGWGSFSSNGVNVVSFPYYSNVSTGDWHITGSGDANTAGFVTSETGTIMPRLAAAAPINFTIAPITSSPAPTGPITPYSPPANFVCFKEGSKILTDKGYKPIQELRKGDLVQTSKNGYKAIFMIGKRDIDHIGSEERIKDQLYSCKQEQYPELLEELVITGCHSILVSDFKEGERERTRDVNGRIFVTDNKYRLPACVDMRASVYDKKGVHTIYHIALENDDYYMNYGVYANGLLVETCSKRYLKELSNMELF